MVIISKDNENVKHIKKLKDKKYREQYNEYVVEGLKLINEAIEEAKQVKTVVICDECIKRGQIEQKDLYKIAKYNCIYVNENLFSSLSDVETHQGILAVISKETEKQEINYDEDVIVILDGVSDPGNVGTILRTVDSTGLKQVIVSDDTVDIYNPKVIRGAMGATFRVNIVRSTNLVNTIKEIKKHKYNIYGTVLDTESKSIYDVEYKKVAIVIGNEANGISEEVLKEVKEKIKIPMLRKNREFECRCCNGYCSI